MKKRRIFLAGPMTGLDDWNHPAFHAAAKRLRARPDVEEVWNPAEILRGDTSRPRAHYMRVNIRMLMHYGGINTIAVLEGWEKSKGARLEVRIGVELGYDIVVCPEALEPFVEIANPLLLESEE